MEKRFRRIGIFVWLIGVAGSALLALCLKQASLLVFLPLIYSSILGGIFFFGSPWLSRQQAMNRQAGLTKPPLSKSEAWLLGISLGVVTLGGGAILVWFLAFPPLWYLQTLLVIISVASAASWLLFFLAKNLNPERSLNHSEPNPKPSPHRAKAILCMRVATGVAAGLLFLIANTWLGQQPWREESRVVIGRNYHTRKNGKSYSANLGVIQGGGFLGIAEPTEINVRREEYDQLVPGQSQATIRIQAGFFGLPWLASIRFTHPSPAASQPSRAEQAIRAEASRPQMAPRAFLEPDSFREESWPNGQKKERVPLRDGREEGLARYWHPNGKLYAEIPWRSGQKDGTFRLYREDGTLEQELSYRAGKPHGLLRWFRADGSLQQETYYFEGDSR